MRFPINVFREIVYTSYLANLVSESGSDSCFDFTSLFLGFDVVTHHLGNAMLPLHLKTNEVALALEVANSLTLGPYVRVQ